MADLNLEPVFSTLNSETSESQVQSIVNQIYNPNKKILVFSWNTGSVGLCETLDPNIRDYHRNQGRYEPYWEETLGASLGQAANLLSQNLTTWRTGCEIADFFWDLKRLISEDDPDIVVIGFQEDRKPGSYFHSHLLPEEMPKLGYSLVKRSRLMGVGITSVKALNRGELMERGLRISIYAKKELELWIRNIEGNMRNQIGDDGQSTYVCSSELTRSKGAVVSYLEVPGVGRFAFVNAHLPFNAQTLISARKYHNKMLRQNEINSTNVCFNNIIENLVLNQEKVPDFVIYFGDLNYRLSDPRTASDVAKELISGDEAYIRDLYLTYDELRDQIRRDNIYSFLEGVNNQGPTFLPTCKLIKGERNCQATGEVVVFEEPEKFEYPSLPQDRIPALNRSSVCWNTGKYDQRVPSWCDRILYSKFDSRDGSSVNPRNLICLKYDRFDRGNAMKKSDHAGVYAFFQTI